MSDEYQLRKDVDRLYDDLYDYQRLKPNVCVREDLENLLTYLSQTYYDIGAIDEIIARIDPSQAEIVTEWEDTPSDSKIPSEKLVKESLDDKQDTLESTVNIKSINGISVLGSGNISIGGGGGSVDIATIWHNPTSDERVPSEKLAKGTLDEKVNRSELHNLDINLTTLELVPKTDNPNGVICFDDLQSKYIEKSNTSGLVKNDGTIDTSAYITSSALTNYIQKSNTNGLIKNDGTIDTTQYLSSLPSHNHDDRYYTESEVDTALNGKQATLVSGTNIKTVNNESLLGSGDLDVLDLIDVDIDMDLMSNGYLKMEANLIERSE